MWLGSHIGLFHSSIFLPGPAGICRQVPSKTLSAKNVQEAGTDWGGG